MESINDINTSAKKPEQLKSVPFFTFLENFKAKLKQVFHVSGNIDVMSSRRGFPLEMSEIMSCKPLSVCIPKKYGGRGGYVHESLSVLSAASYESLGLSLTLGINSSLFLQPVAKFGQESVKADIFKRFLQNSNMGGLMITEPNFGSDALSMQTYYVKNNGHYQIKGKKHWAGLTGLADYWLIAARERSAEGPLRRDIGFFICDANDPGQKIMVEEYFENLGLYMIPYGRNRIDVSVPENQRLQPQSTGLHMMIDMLHRSRVYFPGIGLGFIKRMLDEAIAHAKNRKVGGKSLSGYDQVQQRLSRLQASFTICSAFCYRSTEIADINNDLAGYDLEANVIKSVTSDLMQEASQSLLQLQGAEGFKLTHIAGRSVVDSRPFQIFEGSNDILYAQISEAMIKLMKMAKESNFYQFLSSFHLTVRASDNLKELLNFEVYWQMSQRKMVELGNVISRIVSMNHVIKLGNKGFRTDLIAGTLMVLKQDISMALSNYAFHNSTMVVEDYEENGSWFRLDNLFNRTNEG
jgi:alkylation response protein AidB-like acyl-CoA dehydrogenase